MKNKEEKLSQDETKQTNKMLKKIMDFLVENTPQNKNEVTTIKQFDEKNNTVIEPLYIAYGEVDGHGDTYKNKEAVFQLVSAIEEKKDSLQKAIGHVHKTECFDIEKAWVNREAFYLGDIYVPELQPLVKVKYSDAAFKARLEGRIMAPSIACSVTARKVLAFPGDWGEPKRLLSEFNFDKKINHLSLTLPSQGGPASMKNWCVELEKGVLTREDFLLLEEINEKFTPLEKSFKKNKENIDNFKPDLSQKNGEVMEKTEREVMLEKKLNELILENKSTKVDSELAKYNLNEVVAGELKKSLIALEDPEPVYKSLESLTEKLKVATEVNKVLNAKIEAIEGGSELKKQLLETESGASGSDGEDKIKVSTSQGAINTYNEIKKKINLKGI